MCLHDQHTSIHLPNQTRRQSSQRMSNLRRWVSLKVYRSSGMIPADNADIARIIRRLSQFISCVVDQACRLHGGIAFEEDSVLDVLGKGVPHGGEEYLLPFASGLIHGRSDDVDAILGVSHFSGGS